MTGKQFAKYLKRDLNRCYHCGKIGDDLIPQHRISRGMGGSKADLRNSAANIITLCSDANLKLESDAAFMKLGIAKGWKLQSWQQPESEPVYDAFARVWWLLDPEFGRIRAIEIR